MWHGHTHDSTGVVIVYDVEDQDLTGVRCQEVVDILESGIQRDGWKEGMSQHDLFWVTRNGSHSKVKVATSCLQGLECC
jgi:hypothetical protein